MNTYSQFLNSFNWLLLHITPKLELPSNDELLRVELVLHEGADLLHWEFVNILGGSLLGS